MSVVPEPRQTCQGCGSGNLHAVVDLGVVPLADALVDPARPPDPEPRFPLAVAFCADCLLVQVRHHVPPQTLFVDNYLYFSSYSRDLLEHARRHASGLVESRKLGPDSLVVEIASNDGYLLRNFAEAGIPVLGIDPAPAQAAAAREIGVETWEEFLDERVAERVVRERGHADVVVANNVMAHTPDPLGFARSLATLLAPGGVATIENASVRELVRHGEFDTIYHEHFSYFSTLAMDSLLRRAGLRLVRVEKLPIHGGSLRWFAAHEGEPDESVAAIIEEERADGLGEPGFYLSLDRRVRSVRERLPALIARLRAEGASVAAYGAAAKAAILLNVTQVDTGLIDFVADRNPHKQGLCMPGVRVPIVAPEAIRERRPDYLVVLAWNFADEIMRQEAWYAEEGGRFVIPVPEPRVVG